MEKCNHHTEHKHKGSILRDSSVYPCSLPAKFNVEYISGMRGNVVNEKVCKMHLNALKKRCERVNKLSGYDYCKLQVIEL